MEGWASKGLPRVHSMVLSLKIECNIQLYRGLRVAQGGGGGGGGDAG